MVLFYLKNGGAQRPFLLSCEGKKGTKESGRNEVAAEPLRPARGGFLRLFSTAWFIREFLLGNGPMGSPRIAPNVGSTQTDVHRYYKEALHRVWAEDMVDIAHPVADIAEDAGHKLLVQLCKCFSSPAISAGFCFAQKALLEAASSYLYDEMEKVSHNFSIV
jgi:hypothetical protein